MMTIRKLLVGAILLVTGLTGKGVYASDDRFELLNSSKPLPEFSLLDQNGSSFGAAQLKDHWTLMFMGFTSCPDICPVTLMKLAAARKQLQACVAAPLVPEVVLLAVDPERDTGSLKNGYLNSFGTHNTGITGDWEQIDTLVDGLGGAYRFGKKMDHDGGHHAGHHGYEVIHTTAVYVIDPKGVVVATLGMPWETSAAAEFLAKLVSGESQASRSELSACLAKAQPLVAVSQP